MAADECATAVLLCGGASHDHDCVRVTAPLNVLRKCITLANLLDDVDEAQGTVDGRAIPLPSISAATMDTVLAVAAASSDFEPAAEGGAAELLELLLQMHSEAVDTMGSDGKGGICAEWADEVSLLVFAANFLDFPLLLALLTELLARTIKAEQDRDQHPHPHPHPHRPLHSSIPSGWQGIIQDNTDGGGGGGGGGDVSGRPTPESSGAAQQAAWREGASYWATSFAAVHSTHRVPLETKVLPADGATQETAAGSGAGTAAMLPAQQHASAAEVLGKLLSDILEHEAGLIEMVHQLCCPRRVKWFPFSSAGTSTYSTSTTMTAAPSCCGCGC